MADCPLVFLDTETTSTHPSREAWEVGMIRREPDGQLRETEFFVDVDLTFADPFALSIGRFYERHPVGRMLAGTGRRAPIDLASDYVAATTIAAWTHGAVIIGCTVHFDTETLEPLLRRERIAPGWDYHLLDATTFAAGFLVPHSVADPPFKSREIAAELGIVQPLDEQHTALGDARLAMHMFDAVTGR